MGECCSRESRAHLDFSDASATDVPAVRITLHSTIQNGKHVHTDEHIQRLERHLHHQHACKPASYTGLIGHSAFKSDNELFVLQSMYMSNDDMDAAWKLDNAAWNTLIDGREIATFNDENHHAGQAEKGADEFEDYAGNVMAAHYGALQNTCDGPFRSRITVAPITAGFEVQALEAAKAKLEVAKQAMPEVCDMLSVELFFTRRVQTHGAITLKDKTVWCLLQTIVYSDEESHIRAVADQLDTNFMEFPSRAVGILEAMQPFFSVEPRVLFGSVIWRLEGNSMKARPVPQALDTQIATLAMRARKRAKRTLTEHANQERESLTNKSNLALIRNNSDRKNKDRASAQSGGTLQLAKLPA